jgi:hypothetical protein
LTFGVAVHLARADEAQYWNEFIFEFGVSDRLATEIALE